MSRLHSQTGECLNLVKAIPHASGKYSETVCCAGINKHGAWVRQHPVPYRVLADPQKFRRWDRICYRFTDPGHDGRKETQRVDPDSIRILGRTSPKNEAHFLNSIVRSSTDEAMARGESLALLRPATFSFDWKVKSDSGLTREREKHQALASQESLLHRSVSPLEPCPYVFRVKWVDALGKTHQNSCEDWETSATFFNRRRELNSDDAALQWLKHKYEHDYRREGVVFAMGTHALHQQTWLLVGIIRLDDPSQNDLFAVG